MDSLALTLQHPLRKISVSKLHHLRNQKRPLHMMLKRKRQSLLQSLLQLRKHLRPHQLLLQDHVEEEELLHHPLQVPKNLDQDHLVKPQRTQLITLWQVHQLPLLEELVGLHSLHHEVHQSHHHELLLHRVVLSLEVQVHLLLLLQMDLDHQHLREELLLHHRQVDLEVLQEVEAEVHLPLCQRELQPLHHQVEAMILQLSLLHKPTN